MDFVHLRVKTEYSLLSSVLTIDRIKSFAEEEKMSSIAIMDDCSLSGVFAFCEKISKVGCKPIIGLNLKIIDDNINENLCSLGFLVKNEQGYRNLIQLLKRSQFNYQSTEKGNRYVKISDVLELSDGLICLSGGFDGLLSGCFSNGKKDAIHNYLEVLQNNFGLDFFIELTRHGRKGEKEFEDFMVQKGLDMGIPFVATNHCVFTKKDQFKAYDIATCIKGGLYVSQKDRYTLNDQYYLKTKQEMIDLFSDIPEAISNTVIIPKKCSFVLQKNKPQLPSFSALEKDNDIFRKVSLDGLKSRIANEDNYKIDSDKYCKRLEYEINVIINMGFSGYFLIVADFIRHAKSIGIPVGPGRGSGAGSIVAWSLGITNVDPIYYGLIFERFLNPERVSMPDFDIDFCPLRRGEVIEYVSDKYGHDNVANIITFGKLSAKAVLKDVGRVLQMPYNKVDNICKQIPFNPLEPVSLSKAIEIDSQLRNEIIIDSDIEELINISLQLEGLYRHSSVHAAGIVISKKPLYEIAPLNKDPVSGLSIIGFDMKHAEALGLVKFDFLGLKTLSIIKETCSLVKENRNKDLNIDKINLFDSDVLRFLSSLKTRGIFQLEATVPKEALHKIKVSGISDIAVITSLNRPGPMENIASYIKRKNGQEEIDYIDPSLELALKETCGIIVYQEQVMTIARTMSNYSMGDADILRRAMGKKILSEMEAQKVMFLKGAKENNFNDSLAELVFNKLAKFAGYGFNKSHAVAYSLISYQTAYLKTHYLIEFLTSILNFSIDNTEKLNELVSEVFMEKIDLSFPSINLTKEVFCIKDNKIIYSISALKSISSDSARNLVKEREENGLFEDIFDFCSRCMQFLNKRQLENLIKANCFSVFKYDQNQLLASIDILVKFASKKKDVNKDQFFLLEEEPIKRRPNLSSDYVVSTESDIRNNEFEAYGFYVYNHPLLSSREKLKSIGVYSSNSLNQFANETGKTVILMSGVIAKVRQRVSSKGRFAFLSIVDFDGLYEVAIFSNTVIDSKRELFSEGISVIAKVLVKFDEQSGLRLICIDLYDALKVMNREIEIPKIESSNFYNKKSTKAVNTENSSLNTVPMKERYVSVKNKAKEKEINKDSVIISDANDELNINIVLGYQEYDQGMIIILVDTKKDAFLLKEEMDHSDEIEIGESKVVIRFGKNSIILDKFFNKEALLDFIKNNGYIII